MNRAVYTKCYMCGGILDGSQRSGRCKRCDAAYHKQLREEGKVKDQRKNHRTGVGDVTCYCSAYKFPHALFGGRCRPQRWVESFFDPSGKDCVDCICLDTDAGFTCQVVEKIESTFHCPALREFVRNEGIVLYGSAKRAFERTQRK